MDDIEVTQEDLDNFNKSVEEAVAFVLSIYKREMDNKRLANQSEHVNVNLEHLDRYIQAMYYGNIRNGLIEEAIAGLMSGIRAAYLYGYEQAGVDAEVIAYEEYSGGDFTPLLGPLGKGNLQ